jgi:precorrin-8X/cobalt-precorrin-8 methylmutase
VRWGLSPRPSSSAASGSLVVHQADSCSPATRTAPPRPGPLRPRGAEKEKLAAEREGTAPLFDTYVMVDWSAAAVPRRGRDSIWVGRWRRGEQRPRLENPETRLAARALLLRWLEAELDARRSVLAGFDFPFGYPEGFAARIGKRGDWRSVWRFLAEAIEEKGENANNRFEVAARLNALVSGAAAPFWGCPAGAENGFLRACHHRQHEAIGLAEKRLADAATRGPQPVWKLYGNGSAGSQALTGIPVIAWLRDRLGDRAAIWPFETGLAALERRGGGRVVLAEVYPSLVPPRPLPGEVKDRAQLRAIARHFAGLDDAGRLAPLFAADPGLTPEERRRVEREESWILGVIGAPLAQASAPSPPPPVYDYLREPEAIYRESFARIRRETDLSLLPEALHPLALRLVHAAGDAAIPRDLVWSEGAVAAGAAALARGAPVLVDAAMVAAGIEKRLAGRNAVICRIGDRRVPGLAQKLRTTRAAAAVELWRRDLAGAVVAIGNAPTALFHLLEMVAAGAPAPALVLGFPVGFVGAAEAKAALAENTLGLPFVALRGRRGGSALAAAAVNALARAEATP